MELIAQQVREEVVQKVANGQRLANKTNSGNGSGG
jgi:hypothetical protein